MVNRTRTLFALLIVAVLTYADDVPGLSSSAANVAAMPD